MNTMVPRRTVLSASAAGGLAALMSHGQVAYADPQADKLLDGMDDPSAWRRFLAGLDLQWGKIPRTFYEGPFLGNGGLGAAVYQVGNRVSFTLGDSRVRDHQPVGGSTFGWGRLRIGRLDLVTRGEVTAVNLRLGLFNAQLRGTITTTVGKVDIVAFVDAVRDVLVVSTDPSNGERVTWTFEPYEAKSTRFNFRTDDLPPGLKENPKPEVRPGQVIQRLATGGSTTTAWRATGNLLVATVAHTYPTNTSTQVAAKTLAGAKNFRQLDSEHRLWWNRFYQKSFVSVPDGRIQSFYWIQLYKIASATRSGRPPIGTAAQWLEPTPWTATWWNLNVQLEYWLINATGHWELDSLTESLSKYRDNLVLNVPEKYRSDSSGIARTSQEDLKTLTLAEAGDPKASGPQLELGNLTYALHNVWLRYRHTMDDELLRETLFPILRRAINYMLHFLKKGPDGKWHMPRTYSPEYDFATDANYTLSLLSWGCRTLIWSADRLKIADPLIPKWNDVVTNLVAPPQGPDGLWIGADRKLTSSHRHYSHIQWFYPLYVLDVDKPENRDLLERSLKHWISFEGALQGYTYTGASSMSSMLRKGEDSLKYLNQLLDLFVQPNTMYAETGPVIETPLSGAQSVHDMLISSWGDRIRVFPGVPKGWANTSFKQLRTQGAFEVSASRRKGVTEWVHIKSLAGEPLRVDVRELPKAPQVLGSDGKTLEHKVVDGVLTVALKRDEEVLIGAPGVKSATVKPLAAASYAWGKPRTRRGRTTPIDLSGIFNNLGVSAHDAQQFGDLGNGYTFPAEQFFEAGDLRLGEVSWTLPERTTTGEDNLVPTGQRVSVRRGRYARINLLGATIPTTAKTGEFAADGTSATKVTAVYADGTKSTVDLRFSLFDANSSRGDDVALQVTHRHSAKKPGVPPINQSARVYHQWVSIDSSRQLVALEFAKNDSAHIFALSLEAPLR